MERINKTLTMFPSDLKSKKVLIFTDLHFHKHRASSIFLPIIENVLKEILKAVEENNIGMVWFIGDWFENKEKIGTEEFVLTTRFFYSLQQMGVFTILVPGNHDKFLKSDSKTTMTTIESFNVMDKVVCINEPCCVLYSKKAYHFFPHSVNSKQQDIKNLIRDGLDNYFIGHPELVNIEMSNEMLSSVSTTDVDTNFLNKHFKMSFLGHYHNAKKYGNSIVVGSPYQQNFGESNNKNYVMLYDLDTDKITSIQNMWSPKFVKLMLKDLSINNLDDISKVNISNSFVRIILNKSMDTNLLIALKEHLGKTNLSVETRFDYEDNIIEKGEVSEKDSDDLKKKLMIVDLSNSKNITDFFNTYLDIFKQMPDNINKEKLKSIIDESVLGLKC